MFRYFLKRLLLMIPVVLGVSFIVFTIMAITPGDPGSIILGAGAVQEDIDALNHELGYDQPFFSRYFMYIKDVVTKFNFGTSYYTKQDVRLMIASKIPFSFAVAFNAILFSVIVGIPLGVLSAVKQYSLLDSIPTFMAMMLASAPGFLIGMVLMLIFSLHLGWLPTTGVETAKHYILPMLALGLPYAGRQLRFTRSSMLETIRQDYIRTVRAKGAPERRVIWGHAMRNALMPVITVVGNNFGGLLGGAVVVETLFTIPGLGSYIVDSIKQKDVPSVMGGTMALATMFAFIMLAVDLLYALVDPRIRAKYSRK